MRIVVVDGPQQSPPAAGLVMDRRSGLWGLVVALTGASTLDSPAVAAGARTSAIDFKPRDLEFPDFFEGLWTVTSVLTKVDVPYGEAAVPDIRVVRRAQDDLNRPVRYTIRFIRGAGADADVVVMDRRWNTGALLSEYMPGMSMERAMERIQWSPASPDRMVVNVGSLVVTTDVTRRSQERTAEDALTTNEFTQQFFDDSNGVKLKASRAYTKWKWRTSDVGGKQIIASQTIADYSDPADPGSIAPGVPLQSVGQPIVLTTYRLSLVPAEPESL
jgi:hypothetical protein